MISILRLVFKSLSRIAAALELLAKLYKLDLESRTPPVILTTEEPTEDDTQVWYGDESDTKKRRRWGNPKDWFNREVE